VVDKDLGFSLWLDFVEREYLQNEFHSLVEKGIINGATSNPAIFAAAITSSAAYKEQLASLQGRGPKEKYEALAIEDIRTAAKALRGCYDADNDGYISIEVDPFLSNDTEGTVAEGKRLYAAIGAPNVMVKVPATDAGYAAMTALMREGISVNATLIFSPAQAQKCLEAMQKGAEEYQGKVNGVISVFVSRFDRLLDEKLIMHGVAPAKVGIYNAAKIYQLIEDANVATIRTLFASTGVKGDALRADYYIRELLAGHTINTAPLATIESYVQAPSNKPKLPIPTEEIRGYFAQVKEAGVDMDDVYDSLLKDGLSAFEKAFQEMLASIE
jgi:transaldolase